MTFAVPVHHAILSERSGGGVEIVGEFGGCRQRR